MLGDQGENHVWGYVLAYGFVCVDLRIETYENETRSGAVEKRCSIHGIIQFIDDPGYDPVSRKRKNQIRPFDVKLYDRIVFEDDGDRAYLGMGRVRRKILGVELEATEPGLVSLDPFEEHVKWGYRFKAHGVLNLPRTVEEAEKEWGMPPGPSPDPPLVTTKDRIAEMVDLCTERSIEMEGTRFMHVRTAKFGAVTLAYASVEDTPNMWIVGGAFCAPSDKFSRAKGRHIALGRLKSVIHDARGIQRPLPRAGIVNWVGEEPCRSEKALAAVLGRLRGKPYHGVMEAKSGGPLWYGNFMAEVRAGKVLRKKRGN